MPADVFGDLTEWGTTLEKLEKLRSEGELDEHQPGLARILRFRANRRLQQAVLECVPEVNCASDLLIADTLNVLVDQEAPLTVRVTAAEALARLIPKREENPDSTFEMDRVLETIRHVARRSQAPVLRRALDEALSIPVRTS
jgi:hypothetical protein